MDIFGTRWRIVEKRKFPHTKDLSTVWVVQHKFLGLFWTTFVQEYLGGNEMSEFYEDFGSESDAKKALLEKLGEKRFYKKLSERKIEFIKLPPIEFGVRILEVTNPGERGYVLKRGHYEGDGMLFVPHNSLFGFCKNISEVLMKADLGGLRVDNRKKYDSKCSVEDRDDGVFVI